MLSSRTKHLGAWLALSLMVGCGSSPSKSPDAGSEDAAIDASESGRGDAAIDDAGQLDDAGDVADAGDASAPTDDFGAPCVVDDDCQQRDCNTDQLGGYCSGYCYDDEECGANHVCHGNRCFAGCDMGEECERTGYVCVHLETRDDGDVPVDKYACHTGVTIGGRVLLASGVTIVIRDEAGGEVTLSGDGNFTLPNRLAPLDTYAVTFEPQGDLTDVYCAGRRLSGTIQGLSDFVSNIEIDCARRLHLPDLGDACTAPEDCSQNECISQLVGGYCTAVCRSHLECGEDDLCLLNPALGSGLCFEGCETDADCTRSGYFCTLADAPGSAWPYACYPGSTLGGTATVPAGVTVVVQGGDAGMISLTTSGPFTLPNRVEFGSDYSVTFETQGDVSGVQCSSEELMGLVDEDEVTRISIVCAR